MPSGALGFFASKLAPTDLAAGQRLLSELHAGQTVGHQRADIAVVAALRRGNNRAVMLAESQQGFFIAQTFEQRQTQGFARAFVLPGRVFHAAIVEGLRLIVVTCLLYTSDAADE